MRLLLATVFVLSFLISSAQVYVRYNQLGYAKDRPKEIVVMSDMDIKSEQWVLFNPQHDTIAKGVLNGSITGKGEHMPLTYNYTLRLPELLDTADYILGLQDSLYHISVLESPSQFIPSEILRYFRVQRSGTTKTLDSKVSHTGDRLCPVWTKSSNSNNSWQRNQDLSSVDMLGGWYDAGDYIKFTLTTAYASYLMLRSYERNPSLYDYKKYSKSNLNDILDEAKWGLDYLLKVHPNDDVFVIQVGSADDHKQGDRLPHQDELDGKRQAYSAFSPTQMGYTIAALALGARLFEDIDPVSAKKYREQAVQLFNLAIDCTQVSWIEEGWETFYADQAYFDNMELAATELYLLTEEAPHLYWAKKYADMTKQAYWSSWANCNLLAHNRLFPFYENVKSYLSTDLTFFNGIATGSNNLWGVPHKYTWATLYSFLSVATGSIEFEQTTNDVSFSSMKYNVLDYTLGRNNWGVAMVVSPNIRNSVNQVYSQVYKLKTKYYPTGAVAEGPGDRATHDRLSKYFKIPADHPFGKFNSNGAVFYDHSSDFQCMETTITGLADALYFFTLVNSPSD